jgi:hypothetical protein
MRMSSGETTMTLSTIILRALAMSGEEVRAPQHSQVYICMFHCRGCFVITDGKKALSRV